MNSQANAAPEARLGQIIDERYRVVEHIASGGMASVYRAEHVHNRTPYAIKVLHPEFSGNPEIAARFQREVQAYRRVQHPHVVAAMDFGRLGDGCLYMVLEFIRGQDLCELLYREKPIDQVRAAKIALQVSLALVVAHAATVVHRDLKPDNIMLVERDGDPDYVKVVDFGIAKMAARGQALTALGSVFGTPDYMAPEQARGGQIDHRSDLYTLGTVLYEMLAGQPPFSGTNPAQVILAQVSQPPPPLPPHVDRELAGLVLKLLAKDPAHRVQSALELAEHFLSILRRLAPQHPVLFSGPVRGLPTSAVNVEAKTLESAVAPVAQGGFAPVAQHGGFAPVAQGGFAPVAQHGGFAPVTPAGFAGAAMPAAPAPPHGSPLLPHGFAPMQPAAHYAPPAAPEYAPAAQHAPAPAAYAAPAPAPALAQQYAPAPPAQYAPPAPRAPQYPAAQAALPVARYAPQSSVGSRFPTNTDTDPIDINQYTSKSLTWVIVLLVLGFLIAVVFLLARFVLGLL